VTFSDSRVATLIRERFIPVWESVAPVTIATYELGEGRTFRGIVSGEIALYFCRPDGKVFDVLPALQSPHATYWALKGALEYYEKTGATEEAVRAHHGDRLRQMAAAGRGEANDVTRRSLQRLEEARRATEPGTKTLGEMGSAKVAEMPDASKFNKRLSGTAQPLGSHPLVVVEPGGYDYYKRRIHAAIEASPLRTPDEWKSEVFERILNYPLKGGEVRYDVNTLAPVSILEE
jgi:hypothetical protein